MTSKRLKRIFLPFLFLVFLLAFLSIDARAKVTKKVLPDGLTVIVEEVHSAPVVALQMWVKVGGADEIPEKAGISHVFEHMLFKGTKKRKVGEIAKTIESLGGDINAYTSFDNTVYHLVVPSRHFSTGLDILGDAIQHSAFDPVELKKELEVILEEIRMNEDSPMRTLYREIFQTAYKVHPYGRPVIGTMETVKSFTRKDILDFFKRWYIPNNMTLVISGDVDTASTLRAVEKGFRDFKRSKDPHKKRPAEPPQKTIRTSIKEMDVKETYLGMAFHIPPLKSPDTYALDVLSGILGEGVSSRLYRALKIKKEIVHDISSYTMSLKDPGLFFITAGLDSKDVKKAAEEILFQIKKLSIEGPDPEELDRARTNLESDFIYSRETMQGRARTLGYYQTVAGDYRYERRYLDGISAVTAEDVKKAAARFLRETNMSVAVVAPEGTAIERSFAEEAAGAAASRAGLLKKEVESKRATKKVKLENGITLIVKEVHTNPTVAFYATFPGGLRYERPEKNGIGNFTAAMLTRGTKTRTREALAREVEGMAGSVGGFSGRNSTGASAEFLSRDFDRGLDILADILKNPTFPEKEVESLRKDILAAIKRREDSMPSLTFKLLLKKLYGTHPYGMPVEGTKESVARITREDLVEHYKRFFVPGRMVLAVVGDVKADYVIEKIKEKFGDFKRKSLLPPGPPEVKRPSSIVRTGAVRQKTQTNIALGFTGTTIGSPDSYPLSVMTEILSGQGGRLFIELRDRRSLAYTVSAFTREGVDPGFFALYIACAPEKKKKAIKGLISELKKIRRAPVTETELKRAKNYIIGTFQIGLQEVSSQASEMATDELLGLGFDYAERYPRLIEAVTAGDVLRVAKKYIDFRAYAIAIVGPEEKASATEGFLPAARSIPAEGPSMTAP